MNSLTYKVRTLSQPSLSLPGNWDSMGIADRAVSKAVTRKIARVGHEIIHKAQDMVNYEKS
jgi:hypothetical protein